MNIRNLLALTFAVVLIEPVYSETVPLKQVPLKQVPSEQVPSEQVPYYKLIRIKNGDANAIAVMIQKSVSLLEGQPIDNAVKIEKRQIERILVEVDRRTNSIIIFAPPGNEILVNYLETVAISMDVPEQIEVIQLRYIPAEEIPKVFQGWISDPKNIIVDPKTARVIIKASEKTLKEIREVIEKIDVSEYNIKAEQQYIVADLYFRDRNIERAIESFRNVIEKYPDSELAEKALIAVDNIYSAMGMDTKTVAVYRSFIRSHPDNRNSIKTGLMLGSIFKRRGEFGQAISEYREVADRYPETEEAVKAEFEIGSILEDELGDNKQAEVHYRIAAKNSKVADLSNLAKYRIGMIQYENDNHGDAVSMFKELYSNEKSKLEDVALYQLGRCYDKTGDTDLALKTREEFLRKYPDSRFGATVMLELGDLLLFTLKKPDDALKYYRDVYEKYARSKEAGYAYFRSVYIKSRYAPASPDKTVDEYRHFIENYPDNEFVTEACHEAGRLSYEKLKNYESAREFFRTITNIASRDTSSYFVASAKEYLFNIEMKLAPITGYYKIIKDFAGTTLASQAQFEIGNWYESDNNPGETVKAYLKFIETYPKNKDIPRAFEKLGDNYALLKKYDSAGEYYSKLIKEYPNYENINRVKERLKEIRAR